MPQVHGANATTDLPEIIKSIGRALCFFKSSADAGERLISSTNGSDYVADANEWKAATITVASTGDLTVYNGPCLVRAVRVRKTNDSGTATVNTVGIILIKNGAVVKDGAAAAATPGTVLYDGLGGTIFNTSLILNFASTSDSLKIEVLYRPLDATVTW